MTKRDAYELVASLKNKAYDLSRIIQYLPKTSKHADIEFLAEKLHRAMSELEDAKEHIRVKIEK